MLPRIGFIGAGVMGAPMIANLTKAGVEVVTLPRSDRSRERAAEAGAMEVHGVVEFAQQSDVVITMLPDSPDVHDAVIDSGLIDHLRRGTIVVDMSTIRPDMARQIHAALAPASVGMLDAPVSGGEAAAIDGTLSIMVGGDAGLLDQVRPILTSLGTTITHVGGPGAGQATKAANQLVVAANLQALAEAIVLLEATGVDVEAALTAIGGGLAGSTALERKKKAFLSDDFRPGFRIALHDKDLAIVESTARSAGIALPLFAVVSQIVASLKATGRGDLDHGALLLLARELNGTTR
ncbi:2-hydroxy-3-oxopropionate reductase [Microbacterium faecale]|uniref:2-hydroxy-3-oxopropionate reductase n=1 Tax=Microbacterium faecale TaxID=1804630 RepID=A0A917DCK8_9MICO|nr:2-hydroxy-3-oxopropionate reductase [Microbacterium faecale]